MLLKEKNIDIQLINVIYDIIYNNKDSLNLIDYIEKNYEPLTLVLPKTVVDGYNIGFNEANIGIDGTFF